MELELLDQTPIRTTAISPKLAAYSYVPAFSRAEGERISLH